MLRFSAAQNTVPHLVVGVVTRTDLINVMTSEPGQVLDYQENSSRERNVAKLLRDRLPKDQTIFEVK